uniref:Uncharacterized protein n=1 Tax=viral metagenome TaxID=1070528 RepID=A0A2V0R9Y8_9ZZZZ
MNQMMRSGGVDLYYLVREVPHLIDPVNITVYTIMDSASDVSAGLSHRARTYDECVAAVMLAVKRSSNTIFELRFSANHKCHYLSPDVCGVEFVHKAGVSIVCKDFASRDSAFSFWIQHMIQQQNAGAIAGWINSTCRIYPVLKCQGYYRQFYNDNTPLFSVKLNYRMCHPEKECPITSVLFVFKEYGVPQLLWDYMIRKIPFYCTCPINMREPR